MNHLADTVSVIIGAGTVQLDGRAAAVVEQVILLKRELRQHPCAELSFNFDPSSMTIRLTPVIRKYFEKHGVKNGNGGNGA